MAERTLIKRIAPDCHVWQVRGMAEMTLIKLGEVVDKPQRIRIR
jgi:hypothetical protein